MLEHCWASLSELLAVEHENKLVGGSVRMTN